MGQRGGSVAVLSILRLLSVTAHNPIGNQCITNTIGGQNTRHIAHCGQKYHHIKHCGKSYTFYPYYRSCARDNLYTTYRMSSSKCHTKARCRIYPRTENLPEPVQKCPVTDDQVPWDADYLGYEDLVTKYTSPGVLKGPVWADDPDPSKITKFNDLDSKVDRKSAKGKYEVVNGYPRNPEGRTGMHGRGCLGRWGPNHAGDPIVTRWKRDETHEIVHHEVSGKPILQFVSVQRRDNNEWALPGGMVDPGESRTETIKREFGEEALNTLVASDEEKKAIELILHGFFNEDSAVEIYEGYVDDPRNTDNAWMETKAYNFHDNEGTGVALFQLKAGDDAKNVQWMDIDSSLNLYASHIDFIHKTAQKRGAHW